jgi:hypothetical protein
MKMLQKFTFLCSVMLLLTFTDNALAGNVVFQESFETQPLGSIIGNMPEVGSLAYQELYGGTDVVQSSIVNGGTKALQVDRYASGGQLMKGFALFDEGLPLAGSDFIYKADWYRPDSGANTGLSVNFGTGADQAAWWVHPNGNYYTISYAGNYVNTGYAAGVEAWETVEIVMHYIDAGAPYVTATWDLYLTAASTGNIRAKIASDVVTPAFHGESYNRFIISNQASPSTTYWDNISIERIPEPATIALLGLGVLSLKRRK